MLNCEDHQLLLNSLQDLQSKVRAARTGYTSMIAAGAMPKPDENAYRPTIYYPPTKVEVLKIIFNGVVVDQVIYNGTVVNKIIVEV